MPLDLQSITSKIGTTLSSPNFYLALARYSISFSLIPYGVSKILQVQFVLLPFDAWREPLEQISGPNLAWTFLGYAPWFQVLLGIFEFIPCVLLLFRRTSLLGAIILFPTILSVVLINFALNLWDTTKEISLLLLFGNILILILERKNIQKIFEIIIAKGSNRRYSLAESGFNILFLAVALYLIITDLTAYIQQKNELTGDWRSRHPFEWKLKSESINDSLLVPRQYSCFFGPFGMYSEEKARWKAPEYLSYELDEANHILTMKTYSSETVKLKYRLSEWELHLEKKMGGDSLLRQTFVKRVINSGIP